ncbi:hypothetical protein BGZ73_002362 [Actinomortierella ambigua]|nr:hypothetical protein BGZ73_002362 [Actinomortierella ambigua]
MKFIILASALALVQAAAGGYVTLPIERRVNHAVKVTPESLTTRYLQRRAADGLPLTNVNHDVLYSTPVQLGTPPQTFNLAIDTGSPVTWVSSVACVSPECRTVNKYNCNASSTCRPLGQPFEANYVDGSRAAGTYHQEQYTLGKIKFPGIAGIVTDNNAQLPRGIDGIMGLWYFGQGVTVPVLDRMKNATVLDQNIMGVYLKSSDQTAKGLAPNQGGEVTFGGINAARYTGELSYINNVGPSPWTIPLSGVAVDGKAFGVKNVTAIMDTGTTAFLIPEADADAINGAIPGAQKVPANSLWVLPCNGTSKMTLTFGGFSGDVPYEDLILESTATLTTMGRYCVSTVMYPGNTFSQLDSWLIGDAFLKNVFSVYDFSTPTGRIGLAKLADNQPNAGTGTLSPGGPAGGGGSKSANGSSSGNPNSSGNGRGSSSSSLSSMIALATVGSTLLALVL